MHHENERLARLPVFVLVALAGTLSSLSGCGSSSAGGTTVDGTPDTVTITDGGVADTAGQDGGNTGDSGSSQDSAAPADAQSALDSTSADTAADAGPADTGTQDAGPIGCPKQCGPDQQCTDGKCVDVKKPCGGPCATGTYCDTTTDKCTSSKCTLPTSWSPHTHKLSVFQVAQSAQGCDLTGDKKPNNVLGNILKLYPAVNTELEKSINDGLFNLLLEADGLKDDGSKFQIIGLLAEVDPSNSSCSMTSPWAKCKFTVDDDNYGGGPAGTPCPPRVLFEPAQIDSGVLTAGNPKKGQKVVITLPTVVPLDITLSQVSVLGYPKVENGEWIETKLGKLCGVITQQDFDKAIESVPADAWQTISLTKEQVKVIINATLKPDIDTNGDGFPDAISVAMLLETVPAQITKMTF